MNAIAGHPNPSGRGRPGSVRLRAAGSRWESGFTSGREVLQALGIGRAHTRVANWRQRRATLHGDGLVNFHGPLHAGLSLEHRS
jgi:hypothetical protein